MQRALQCVDEASIEALLESNGMKLIHFALLPEPWRIGLPAVLVVLVMVCSCVASLVPRECENICGICLSRFHVVSLKHVHSIHIFIDAAESTYWLLSKKSINKRTLLPSAPQQ